MMLMQLSTLISLVVMNQRLARNYTSVRNVRQVIKVRGVCIITPAVNIKVFVIPVNTASMRQQDGAVLKDIKR